MYGYMMGELTQEADVARAKYGSFASAHEAYGVLAEEMMELMDAIHDNLPEAIAYEAVQVAAVALRLAHEIRTEPAMRERSGVR